LNGGTAFSAEQQSKLPQDRGAPAAVVRAAPVPGQPLPAEPNKRNDPGEAQLSDAQKTQAERIVREDPYLTSLLDGRIPAFSVVGSLNQGQSGPIVGARVQITLGVPLSTVTDFPVISSKKDVASYKSAKVTTVVEGLTELQSLVDFRRDRVVAVTPGNGIKEVKTTLPNDFSDKVED
jgi:hypothetical protein